MRKIILASASPRRRELLRQIGLKFIVDPVNGEEMPTRSGLEPVKYVELVSMHKAKTVAGRHPDAIIIAADTIGVLDGKIIGKPQNAVEAGKILATLSGQAHCVITGYTVMDTGTGKTVTKSIETLVYIKSLTGTEIEAYVATGEPLDKAGAYGIQGRGAVIVERIEGDYSNVVGLPLFALAETLKEFGVGIL
ncbi:MAG: Maf family protein [Dehalococcoidales bacterium]|nr:Maf family protein [Dehalococcoidales bacterium]